MPVPSKGEEIGCLFILRMKEGKGRIKKTTAQSHHPEAAVVEGTWCCREYALARSGNSEYSVGYRCLCAVVWMLGTCSLQGQEALLTSSPSLQPL